MCRCQKFTHECQHRDQVCGNCYQTKIEALRHLLLDGGELTFVEIIRCLDFSELNLSYYPSTAVDINSTVQINQSPIDITSPITTFKMHAFALLS